MICMLRSGRRSVPGDFWFSPLSNQKQTLILVALERALEGETKWGDFDRKEKSALMKSMG